MMDDAKGAAPVPEATPPADPTSPRAAGGIPLPVLGAAVVAAAALGILLGIKVGKAVAASLVPPPSVEMLRVPCEDCRKRKEAEMLANTSASDVENLVRMQSEVERAGID